jgi:hypothetical protein
MLKGREWLNQRLDSLDFRFEAPPSPTEHREVWPLRFYPWDISSEVQNYSREFVDNQCEYPGVNILLPTMQGNEADSFFIMKQLLGTLGRLLIAPRFRISTQVVVQNPSLSGNSPPVPPATKLLQQALAAEHGGNAGRGVLDIACETQGKSFFIVEMKRPSLFRKKREQCLPDLVGVLQGTSVVGEKSMVQSIGQLFRYLVSASLGYGAISTGDATYFVKRSSDNALHVSKGFQWDEEKFLMTLAYAIQCGYLDKTTYTFDGMKERSSSSSRISCMTHSHSNPTSRSSTRTASLADSEVSKRKANDSRFSQ